MQRASLTVILSVLLVSLFLLSVFSNLLTGYPERPRPDEDERKREGRYEEKEPSSPLFKVSPVDPVLFWRTLSADYYTGYNWLRTTDEESLKEFPQIQHTNNTTKIFTVEINARQPVIPLPLPSPNSTLADISSPTFEGLKLYADAVGNVYKVIGVGQPKKAPLVYNVSRRDVEVDDRLISLDSIAEEIKKKYLQLPDIPIEVWKLAKDLEDPSYSILDQVLADVQFLRTNFVYDDDRWKYMEDIFDYERIKQGSHISSYIDRRKGICVDAATALAIILRIQRIPARISIGYKPERAEGGKLLYYTTGAHALTEVYLPPYGWIQFDATPPLEETPLVKVLHFKKESSPGSSVFYQLSITNRYEYADHFKLFVDSKRKWNVEVAPEELRIEANRTSYALLEVTIPHDAEYGEKDVMTVTVASLGRREVAFSIVTLVQAENIFHVPTTISLTGTNEAVTRGDTFWTNGTVLTANDEQVDNMTLFIFLTKSREAEGVIIGKGYSKQGSFQIESMVPYSMEIGDYKAIPISLGTAQYAPSSSEFIMKVCATTRMELGSEEEFLLEYGAIRGRLLWDNGTGFAEAPISLKITPLATPSESWKLQNQTFEEGYFRIKPSFENPGVYEVEATFPGYEHVLRSNATRVLELKRGIPTIQIFGETTAIRGEVFNISARIRFEDITVWGEPIAVAFDNRLLATIQTGDNGLYTWFFLVNPQERLGWHTFTMALKKGDVCAVHNVEVKSKTKLDTKVSDVAGGMFLLFSASLSDDHYQPIQGAQIVVDNYGMSWKTDKNGNLTFLLDTVKLWPENLVLTAKFEGSELYLPAITEKEVALEPVISLPFLIPLVSPTLVIIIFVYAKYQIRSLQMFRQTSAVKVVEERAVVEEERICGPQKMQPFRIILPDIGAQFPYVWGVKDKLRIEIVLDNNVLKKMQNRETEVFIDEKAVASVKLSQQGLAELSRVFAEKGEYKIQARLPRKSGRRSWKAEIRLRIVDYGEEIISVYNEFLGKLANYGLTVGKEMTAREIENLILRITDFSPRALSKVTTCFEKAEYSNHLTTRKDYETMYLSLKELNADVEHEK